MSNQARRVAVQKHINQFHEGETLASIARRRQTGRGAARESGLSRTRRNALMREQGRRCPQQERTRTSCGPANIGRMDGNEGIPSKSESGVLDMCEMLRGPHHDAANTLSRSAAKCPRQADAPLPNTHVVEGAAKHRCR